MLIVCWSVKGGSGTTVVAAALSILFASSHRSGALAVDATGDLGPALGPAHRDETGLGDWLSADQSVDGRALLRLATPASAGLGLIARGRAVEPTSPRWALAADAFAGDERIVVVDVGTGRPPAALVDAAQHALLVIRPCYLALRRATELAGRATGVIVVEDPGRALRRRDIEDVTGLPVVAEVPVDPAIARAVDAGMLTCRLPSPLGRALRAVA